jgi:hypothetical protein
MAETRAHLFLDVDGVLNAVRPDEHTGWGDWREEEAQSYLLHISKAMCQRLAALDVTLHWVTTWCDDIEEWIAPIVGFGHGACTSGRHPSDWGDGFKFGHVVTVLEQDPRPFIWVDDDAINQTRVETLDSRFEQLERLLVTPDTYQGLTVEDVDAIEAFLDTLT